MGKSLDYAPPTMRDGKLVVKLTKEDIRKSDEHWATSLIGYVLGDTPFEKSMGNYVTAVWNFVHKPQILYHLDDVYYEWRPKFCSNCLKFGHDNGEYWAKVSHDPPADDFKEAPRRKRRAMRKQNNANKVLKKVDRDWNYCCNYPHGVNGRVLLLWKKHLDVQIFHVHEQFIHCEVANVATSISILITIVYARNELSQREVLWQELRGLGANIQSPWILNGDFNNVLVVEERIGLPEMVDSLQLTPLRTKWCYFTWCNKQQATSRVYSKID
ncbi:hypothetical protein R3W88_033902 [Solanum pinnatisectum]|uniref:Uncharacterized protein n=1 Tax=Solanum pinnatisectum TaxID=50273 RepID=A0AAV9K1I4_9SOLN|nr:hypothetical protein R3W88_033902 [Solanum pinnatisectum]